MVVPLVDLGHPGGEGAQRLVDHVVGVLAAELGERLGDLGLLGRHHVGPGGPVRQRDRSARADRRRRRVAAVEEEVGFEVGHRTEDAKTAGVRVDAPALTDEVAAPDERNVTRVLRRRRERRLQRLATSRLASSRSSSSTSTPTSPPGVRRLEAHLAREIRSGVSTGPAIAAPAVPPARTRTTIRLGRSARAHTIAVRRVTSPVCTPCVSTGRLRTNAGAAEARHAGTRRPAARPPRLRAARGGETGCWGSCRSCLGRWAPASRPV